MPRRARELAALAFEFGEIAVIAFVLEPGQLCIEQGVKISEAAASWPNAAYSRLIACAPHRWHVQEAGKGPTLLLHGADGAAQSWRDLFPLLIRHHHVVAPDLPGQGMTRAGSRTRFGLDTMAQDVAAQGWHPAAIIGHSAGAALALRLRELGCAPQAPVIGINAAPGAFRGLAGIVYPPLARALAATRLAADLCAATATEARIRSLLRGTGLTLDDRCVALYLRLARDRDHVDATLSMMAQWRLEGLLSRLAAQAGPVHLIVGSLDRAVPPATSDSAAAVLPDARVTHLPGLGHLAHEERPIWSRR